MLTKRERKDPRLIRKRRIRRKVLGTADRPRLTIYKGNRHIYAQIIDDEKGHTLVAASTRGAEFRTRMPQGGKTIDAARMVGEILGEKALAQGIQQVVFDRDGFLYHGKVKALADAVRERGIVF
ncbi:MAG: 50S ribosomal protein L18 [Candidatus Tectomicrobia bacterium]|uniref:Large ribosomal subunit protein uL18 n=1 Tax=Tectimicrobiota bacterium TaxID=2528274 RepID=A0A932G1W1_UNCTE|nr:50S ribosomal protein L18 [Candidatus Tectomicrobia bacterium]